MFTQKERFALLKRWKEESKLTYDDIASITDIPVSTAQRIIEGRTQSPSFENIAPIVVALGHTLDEYYGIEKDGKEITMISLLKSSMEQQLREKDIILDLRLKEKDAIIEAKMKSVTYLRKLVLILGSTVAIFFLVCMIISFYLLYQTSPGM